MDERVKDSIVRRALQRFPFDAFKQSSYVYMAGNCLNRGEPNDIDIFPVQGESIVIGGQEFLFVIGGKCPVCGKEWYWNGSKWEEARKPLDGYEVM